MPSEMMDQRRLRSSSFLSEETLSSAQRQVGFWKPELVPDNLGLERMALVSGKVLSSSSSERMSSVYMNSAQSSETCQQTQIFKEQNSKPHLESLMGTDGAAKLSMSSWKAASHGLSQQAMFVQHSSPSAKENQINMDKFPYESGLFPSSLPGITNKKYGALLDKSTTTLDSNFDEVEHFLSLKEIEAQTIGNLLPDDDDLFSGVIDDTKVDCVVPANNSDDAEDDLFYSGGGMELEANGVTNGHRDDTNHQFPGEYTHSVHPSRTLFVHNIESILDDSNLRILFERYGHIHMLYTNWKHWGFVIISYYDLRSACNAMRELQNKLLMHSKLNIYFAVSKDNPSGRGINQGTLLMSNLGSSISKDHLDQIFGVYGEIKGILQNPQKHCTFIEFYDIRAADAALRSLNRSDVAGKKIQLQLSHPGFAANLMQQVSSQPKKEEADLCHKKGSPLTSYPSLCYGRIPFEAITSGSLDTGAIKGQHSVSQASVNLHLEKAFNGIPSAIPHHLSSSPVKVASGNDNLNNSSRPLNFELQHMPSFHTHSLHEDRDGLASSMTYSPNTVSFMALNFPGHADGVDAMLIPGLNSTGLKCCEHGNSNCLPLGHQYLWNQSSPHHNRHSGPLMWPNSLSLGSNIPTHPPSQLHGLPRTPSNMWNIVPPVHRQHVGSAPTSNPSLWDRWMDADVFHHGSVGNVKFSGSHQTLYSLEFGSHNIFPQVGGNCIETSISSPLTRLPSPQKKYQTNNGGRKSMIPMPTTFDSPIDQIRSRRSDANSNHVDNKKQYELDIERIKCGEDIRTTLMIKNIPNKYTSKMLLATIDENHRGSYDFIYLPIDFKNKCNVGYAFINMVNPNQIIPFYKAFNGKKWEKFNSEKVASLAYGRIQGKASLIAHFQNSSLMNEDKRCQPILFQSDGPNAGDQEPFPLGMNRSRSGRGRTQNTEENTQGSNSPSNSANGEDSGTSDLTKDT